MLGVTRGTAWSHPNAYICPQVGDGRRRQARTLVGAGRLLFRRDFT
jgi:hypothetical protein